MKEKKWARECNIHDLCCCLTLSKFNGILQAHILACNLYWINFFFFFPRQEFISCCKANTFYLFWDEYLLLFFFLFYFIFVSFFRTCLRFLTYIFYSLRRNPAFVQIFSWIQRQLWSKGYIESFEDSTTVILFNGEVFPLLFRTHILSLDNIFLFKTRRLFSLKKAHLNVSNATCEGYTTGKRKHIPKSFLNRCRMDIQKTLSQ